MAAALTVNCHTTKRCGGAVHAVSCARLEACGLLRSVCSLQHLERQALNSHPIRQYMPKMEANNLGFPFTRVHKWLSGLHLDLCMALCQMTCGIHEHAASFRIVCQAQWFPGPLRLHLVQIEALHAQSGQVANSKYV